MADLVIKQNELKTLDTIIGEIPMKHGMQLLNFINGVVQLRQKEAQEAAELTLVKKDAGVPTPTTDGAGPEDEGKQL